MKSTTTVSPILCLMNWNDEQCRQQFKFNYIPKFASNYKAPIRKSPLASSSSESAALEVEQIDSDEEEEETVEEEEEVENQKNGRSTSTGFFSPVLPTATEPIITTTSIKTTTSTTTVPSSSSSTTKKMTTSTVPIFDLSQITDQPEGSADDNLFGEPAEVTTTTTVTIKKVSTVLPRPYSSIQEAAEKNPDYLGSSIWSGVDELPEPQVTGPAWRTNKTSRTTQAMIRKATTTTTTPMSPTTFYDSRRGDSAEITALITSSLRPATTATTRKGPTQFINPVRPTTPMGDIATTTSTSMQDPQSSEFPRTPLIMCSSLAVIIAIAAVVFFVFKCRQNPPNSEHYTMAMKSQSGYTAIAPELSPPMNHDRGNNDSCTQPLIAKPHIWRKRQGKNQKEQKRKVHRKSLRDIEITKNVLTIFKSKVFDSSLASVKANIRTCMLEDGKLINGNGYEPIKGSVITNGNGASIMRNGNGHGPPSNNNKKKDFKEWYV